MWMKTYLIARLVGKREITIPRISSGNSMADIGDRTTGLEEMEDAVGVWQIANRIGKGR